MRLSRAEFLRLAGLVAGGATLAACSPAAAYLAERQTAQLAWPQDAGNFLALGRMTYGPLPQERQRAAEIGMGGWIEEQLDFASLDDRQAELRLRGLDAIHLDASALEGWEQADVVEQFKAASLIRQLYSRRQLYETMVEFWTDHFNITLNKSKCWFLKPVDDREVLRAHALGRFGELLWSSAHSPAMLIYLDNQANHRDHPNENYARELMELHSLGVDGGYSQDDVMELARCLTGWSVKEHFWEGDFFFDADIHDKGSKKVLGRSIASAGKAEGEEMLELLASHPSTARFIARKLVQRFVCDQPELDAPNLVERATRAFENSRGDIKTVLRGILLDGLVRHPESLQPKFKRPLNFVASALRLLGAETRAGEAVTKLLSEMGQPSFEWPTPDGPPDVAAPWQSNLISRWKFALALAQNQLPGVSLDLQQLVERSAAASLPELVDQMSLLLLGGPYPQQKKAALLRSFSQHKLQDGGEVLSVMIAGLLSSPAFQWK